MAEDAAAMKSPYFVTEATSTKIARHREESEPLMMGSSRHSTKSCTEDDQLPAERGKEPPRRDCGQASHHVPKARLISVNGRPIRQYARKEIVTPSFLARSATIRLATEPIKVKFPAKVELIATIRHAL